MDKDHGQGPSTKAAVPPAHPEPTTEGPPPKSSPGNQAIVAKSGSTKQEFLRAALHEIKMTLLGSVAVCGVWWISVFFIGLMFPFMHIALIFIALVLFPMLDKREYPEDPVIRVYAFRASTNLIVFLIGLFVVGPLGLLLKTDVPSGALSFFFSLMAITTIFSVCRATINFATVLTKYFT